MGGQDDEGGEEEAGEGLVCVLCVRSFLDNKQTNKQTNEQTNKQKDKEAYPCCINLPIYLALVLVEEDEEGHGEEEEHVVGQVPRERENIGEGGMR